MSFVLRNPPFYYDHTKMLFSLSLLQLVQPSPRSVAAEWKRTLSSSPSTRTAHNDDDGGVTISPSKSQPPSQHRHRKQHEDGGNNNNLDRFNKDANDPVHSYSSIVQAEQQQQQHTGGNGLFRVPTTCGGIRRDFHNASTTLRLRTHREQHGMPIVNNNRFTTTTSMDFKNQGDTSSSWAKHCQGTATTPTTEFPGGSSNRRQPNHLPVRDHSANKTLNDHKRCDDPASCLYLFTTNPTLQPHQLDAEKKRRDTAAAQKNITSKHQDVGTSSTVTSHWDPVTFHQLTNSLTLLLEVKLCPPTCRVFTKASQTKLSKRKDHHVSILVKKKNSKQTSQQHFFCGGRRRVPAGGEYQQALGWLIQEEEQEAAPTKKKKKRC